MIRTQLYFADITDLKSKLDSSDKVLKKQLSDIPAYGFADWEDTIYWDLAETLEKKGADKRLIGYLKMLYDGRRFDRKDPDLDTYSKLTETTSTNQFEDIPRHCYLTIVEVMELNQLINAIVLEDIDVELKEFVTEELKPALSKAIDMDKGLLLVIE